MGNIAIEGMLLSTLDMTFNEMERVKQEKKDNRSLLNQLKKAHEVNAKLGIDVTDAITTEIENIETKLTESDKELRELKLVKYRLNSCINILQGEEIEEDTKEEIQE